MVAKVTLSIKANGQREVSSTVDGVIIEHGVDLYAIDRYFNVPANEQIRNVVKRAARILPKIDFDGFYAEPGFDITIHINAQEWVRVCDEQKLAMENYLRVTRPERVVD